MADTWLVAAVIALVVGFVAFAVMRAVAIHRSQAYTGREELIGKTAEVKSALAPKGLVFFKGELWTAISESGRIEPGEEITITRVDGLKLYVTKKV